MYNAHSHLSILFVCSFVHSFVRSFVHSVTHSLIYSLIHNIGLVLTSVFPLVPSFIYDSDSLHKCICVHPHSFIHSVWSFVRFDLAIQTSGLSQSESFFVVVVVTYLFHVMGLVLRRRNGTEKTHYCCYYHYYYYSFTHLFIQ